MTQVGFKKMNWYPKPSAWKQHVAQRQKRAENVRAFQAQSNALANSFANAMYNQIQGVGEVAAQTAQSRLQKQMDDMRKELEKAYSSFDKLA
jgi:hypothetical protein